MSYEYRRETLSLLPLFYRWPHLGDEGWEVVEVRQVHSDSGDTTQELVIRRPEPADPTVPRWETHVFTTVPGAEWLDHLASCGWKLLYQSRGFYHIGSLQFAQRHGSRRGTDDGDVANRLRDLGYFPVDPNATVAEVLREKWLLSEKLGRDAGTYEAARHWLAHFALPLFLADSPGAPRAGSLAQLDPLLDELLELRRATGDTLQQTVRRWAGIST